MKFESHSPCFFLEGARAVSFLKHKSVPLCVGFGTSRAFSNSTNKARERGARPQADFRGMMGNELPANVRTSRRSAKIVAGKLFAYSIFRMSNHEYDFHVSKVLKTLQENTDPQNLVRATKQVLAKFNQQVAGAQTIAQVLISTICYNHCSKILTGRRHNLMS